MRKKSRIRRQFTKTLKKAYIFFKDNEVVFAENIYRIYYEEKFIGRLKLKVKEDSKND